MNTYMQEYTIQLLQKTRLTHNMISLVFDKPADFEFTAGQFVQFLVPDGEKTVLRAYSICSTPSDNELHFCVKVLENGKASTLFAAMNDGDSAIIRGPRGNFVSTASSPLYFVATGAGIAPIMSILQDELIHKKTDTELYLLFGVHDESDLFWQQRLDDLTNTYNNFSFNTTVSQPQSLEWRGLKGRVTDHLDNHSNGHQFFICGNPDMVKDVRNILLTGGVEKTQIHFEIF